MILDSRAVVAVFLREPGHAKVIEKMSGIEQLGMGAPTACELGIVLSAKLKKDARTLIKRFFEESDVEVIAFGPEHWDAAVRGYWRYGKGRHPAALNLGDCMTYAVAKLASQPLLCIGSDFAKTDLALA